jgi:ABC-type lipoprotein export system ATPase subunit
MSDHVIDLHGGSRTLPQGQSVLSGIDLEVSRGECVAIVGRSGSGKSTLLACLGLISPFDRGTRYCLAGTDVRTLSERQSAVLRARSIGFVLQNSGLISHLNVLENVRMPLLHSRDISLRETKRRAHRALNAVAVGHLSTRRPAQLSGGERQRVAIARALVVQPSVILADEPTGALDEETGHLVLSELLNLVSRNGASLIVVTHDAEIAAQTDRTFRISDGRMALAERVSQ